MATVERFEDLEVWKTARQLTTMVYRLTREAPFSKDYGLKDQMQRAAVSVMNNVAEGFESRTQRIFIDLLGRARGSAGEVRSMAYVALDLGYISKEDFDRLTTTSKRASRQIYRLVHYLETRPNARRVQEETAPYEITS